MELRQLKYLLSIGEEGTFTAAAEKLFISQSALSQQVKSMEEELGVPLFDRSRNHVQFTQAGELLHQRAKRIVKEVDEAKTAIDDLEDLCRGTLKIGVVQTVNAYLIPQVVSAFSTQFPNIHLKVEECSAPDLEEKIYDHELDLGISFTPTEHTNLTFEPIFKEELLLIVNSHHPLAQKNALSLKALDNRQLILLSQDYCTRRIWDRLAKEADIFPNIHIEMNTIGGILSALQNGSESGTVLPALTMRMQAAGGLTSVILKNPTPKRTVGFIWRASGYKSMASLKFAEITRQRFESNFSSAGHPQKRKISG